MVDHLLIVNAGVLLVYMSAWFVAARLRNRLDTVDIAWGLGFAVSAWAVEVQQPSGRSLAIALLVTAWATRLANHIYQRAKTRDEDPRYKAISQKWKGNFWLRAYGSIFLVQGALIWIVGLPIVMAAGKLTGSINIAYLGTDIWCAGFIIETIADRQLADYLKLNKRPKVLETGLWRYSRHPNYFGELLQWWGIGIFALQAHNGWIGLFGPLTLSLLIMFVSGIPPIEKRRSKDPAYKAYQKRTSSLIPLPVRK